MRFKKGFNPFYVLLVVVGTAFCLTACAYGLMAMREMRPQFEADAQAAGPHELMTFMQQHGERLLLAELAVLAGASLAAMATDGYWQRRATNRSASRGAHAADEAVTSEETMR